VNTCSGLIRHIVAQIG